MNSVEFCPSDTEQNNQLLFSMLSQEKLLLVFINPHSGNGKSLKTFSDKVSPKLNENNIKYDIVVTKEPNHARNVVTEKADLSMYNGILIFSGDGLIFEVINGILDRADGFRILPILPIGIVPSGSGNGLLCSVLHKYGTIMNGKAVMKRALEIVTSSTAKAETVALYSVKTDKEKYAAFLSIGWGLMADIDIESEKWRKSLGPHRFPVMGFIRSCNLRSYKGRLTYRLYKFNNFSPMSNEFGVYDETTDEKIKMSVDKQWEFHDSKGDEAEEIVVEGTFVNVYAVMLPYINTEGPFAPTARLEENKIHLSYILLEDIGSRVNIIKYLAAIANQRHLNMPFVKTVEISSMKLEVLSNGSYVVLDGEVIDTKTIEVCSTRNSMCVFSKSE